MKIYKRKTIFSDKLSKYDIFANKDDYIEIIEWKNGEGFDVEIFSKQINRFQLTWGQYKLLTKMINKLNKL